MTEIEAKKRWCPMSRYILLTTGELISNRQGYVNDPWDSCLASGCMMWRWKSGEGFSEQGYCGLGGPL